MKINILIYFLGLQAISQKYYSLFQKQLMKKEKQNYVPKYKANYFTPPPPGQQSLAYFATCLVESFLDESYQFLQFVNRNHLLLCEEAVDVIEDFIQQKHPNYTIKVYGSISFGLGIQGSDINLSLQPKDKDGPNPLETILEQVKHTFAMECTIVNNFTLQILFDPRMAKAKKQNFQLHQIKPVKVKLLFNPFCQSNYLVRSSQIIEQFLENRDNFKIILIILKTILKKATLIRYNTDGLDSYSLFLMFSSYVTFHKKVEDQTKAAIFRGFIEFFGFTFDPATTIIHFSRAYPCFMNLAVFKHCVDPLKRMIRIKYKTGTNIVVTPLHIFQPIRKKIMNHKFQRVEELFQLFRNLNYFFYEFDYVMKEQCIKLFALRYWNHLDTSDFIVMNIRYATSYKRYLLSNKLLSFGLFGNRYVCNL